MQKISRMEGEDELTISPLTKEEKKRLASLGKERAILKNKVEIIRAKHVKKIYTDPEYDTISYNARGRVQEADLTLALAEDNEFQDLLNKDRDLKAEEVEILGDDLLV